MQEVFNELTESLKGKDTYSDKYYLISSFTFHLIGALEEQEKSGACTQRTVQAVQSALKFATK